MLHSISRNGMLPNYSILNLMRYAGAYQTQLHCAVRGSVCVPPPSVGRPSISPTCALRKGLCWGPGSVLKCSHRVQEVPGVVGPHWFSSEGHFCVLVLCIHVSERHRFGRSTAQGLPLHTGPLLSHYITATFMSCVAMVLEISSCCSYRCFLPLPSLLRRCYLWPRKRHWNLACQASH